MAKFKVAVVGLGSIAQVVHLPILKKMEDIELVAVCDVDESKADVLTKKFNIPHWYEQIDNMIAKEELDAIHICANSHYHFPMSYLALQNDIHVFVEKPLALNRDQAVRIARLAKEKKLTVMVGMQNRFRDDVQILREFIDKDELGEIFYIKAGWLKKWDRSSLREWQIKKQQAGGGVMIDLGSQLIDLAMYLTGLPKIRSVRMYDYTINPDFEVEDAALAVLQTQDGMSVTIEVSWRMHLDHDMIYTHIFGKKGAAYLNPLRINKELHNNLVNVTPMLTENNKDRYKQAYRNEIHHFYRVLDGTEENMSSADDAYYIMSILDALYESSRSGKEIFLD